MSSKVATPPTLPKPTHAHSTAEHFQEAKNAAPLTNFENLPGFPWNEINNSKKHKLNYGVEFGPLDFLRLENRHIFSLKIKN